MATGIEPSQRASLGGQARAKTLTAEQRSDIAKKGARARWSKNIPRATHEGILQIGDMRIPCANLDGGLRVINQSGFMIALGRARGAKGRQYYDADVNMPAFLTAKNLKPFIPKDLEVTSSQIAFRPLKGARAFGYSAELLPLVCEVFLDAEKEGALAHTQKHIAKKAHILIRGLARVGILALVDEATGYQYDRARNALEEILEKFISRELLKWAKTFPDEFYEELFRLKGWTPNRISQRRPLYCGKLTNNLVYERLAPGVLTELRRVTPKGAAGRPKHHYHRRLTEDVGHPKLREHLASVITLMRACDDWPSFYKLLTRSLPKYGPVGLFAGKE